MAFADLRAALAALRERGRLVEVSEPLAARHEVGAFLAVAGRERPATAYLFTNVTPDAGGPGPALPVVANVIHSRDVLALAMGVPRDQMVQAYAERIRAPLAPRVTRDVPVGEVVYGEGEFDLTTLLPVLTHYEGDAGPYLTAGQAAVRNPETGMVERTLCRMQLRGADRLGLAFVNPPLGPLWRQWVARGETVRVAVVLGLEPVTQLAGALPPVPGVDKLALGGALRGEPIEVAPGPYSGVEVPARAEFLFEGDLEVPGLPDGPLGEISGYSLSFPETPTLRIRRVSHRTAPHYHALLPTGPEGDLLTGLVVEAQLAPQLRALFPIVRKLAFVPGTFGSSVVVRVAAAERTRVRSLLYHALSLDRIKKVVVVAEDVDPEDLLEVEWSVATRCQPDVDVIVVSDVVGHPIDPSVSEDKRTSRLGIDATGFGHGVPGRVSHPADAVARAREVLARTGMLRP